MCIILFIYMYKTKSNYVSDETLTKLGFIKIYEIISPPQKYEAAKTFNIDDKQE